MWKRKNTKEGVSVDELLDDFVNREERTEMNDDDYVSMMLKKDAKKTIEKHRRNEPVKQSPKKKSEPPVVSEKIATMKRCQNCYFSVKEKKLGGSIWCNCTNPGRSTNIDSKGSWVKSQLNPPCWKPAQE